MTTIDELKSIHERGLAMLKAASPGPWNYDEPPNWLGMSARIMTVKFEMVGQTSLKSWGKKRGRANARLLAASWSMLSAAVAGLGEAIEEWERDLAIADAKWLDSHKICKGRAAAFATIIRAALGEKP